MSTQESKPAVTLVRVACMVPTRHSACKRPVQYVFYGDHGPYYRCGKHGQELMRHRNDVEVVDYELGDVNDE